MAWYIQINPNYSKREILPFFLAHAEFMDTGEIFPCLFCLMEHRQKDNYDELYKEVRKLINNKGWPFRIMHEGGKMFMDMELANKNSVKECLNDPSVCVCYFHLCGVTNKTIVDLGLKTLVFRSPIFNHHCRMINALATVPARFVDKATEKLVQHFTTIQSEALPILEYWEKNFIRGYVVAETRRKVLPKWRIDEWNIYEKIINKEETSTCKLESWHNRLDRVLMKTHPTFEEFCKVIMGEWVKIDYEMDHLESGFTVKDIRFSASMSEKKRQERIYNVAMSVNNYHTIIDYLNAMAVASKK